jgi:2-keto-4-pentenoate hydratase/2-oxohepta-3-ene-1,7-dioic acid hydratase in catechol pathway
MTKSAASRLRLSGQGSLSGRSSTLLEVDGHRYQHGTTKNLIFSVPTIAAYASRFFELEPGDVVATGAPAGVGLGQKTESRIPQIRECNRTRR